MVRMESTKCRSRTVQSIKVTRQSTGDKWFQGCSIDHSYNDLWPEIRLRKEEKVRQYVGESVCRDLWSTTTKQRLCSENGSSIYLTFIRGRVKDPGVFSRRRMILSKWDWTKDWTHVFFVHLTSYFCTSFTSLDETFLPRKENDILNPALVIKVNSVSQYVSANSFNCLVIDCIRLLEWSSLSEWFIMMKSIPSRSVFIGMRVKTVWHVFHSLKNTFSFFLVSCVSLSLFLHDDKWCFECIRAIETTINYSLQIKFTSWKKRRQLQCNQCVSHAVLPLLPSSSSLRVIIETLTGWTVIDFMYSHSGLTAQ